MRFYSILCNYFYIRMKPLLFVLSIFATLTLNAQWYADSLLAGFKCHTVIQPNDYQGKVLSTIIRPDTTLQRHRGILYIHGFNDYFFQSALCDSVISHSWNFTAVDLRRYGRSLRPGMKRYQVRNLKEYFPDIDSALVSMTVQGIDTIVIIGHSTGGLIASLYMNNNPLPQVRGLILNSPFLGWNLSKTTKNFLIPLVSTVANIFPDISIPQHSDSTYAHTLLRQYDGEWEYDTTKKLTLSPPVTSGWIHAIQSAQQTLRKKSNILVPILLMHSDRSVSGSQANTGDAVLNVDDIHQYGQQLGPYITEVSITGGLHDLILSPLPVRREVYQDIFNWLDAHF